MAENKSRKTESSKRAYHELQTSDMTFDAHSAFVAPTHRKRLWRVLAMPERKETNEGEEDSLQRHLRSHSSS
jgi:hypothetical protein